MNSHSRFPPRLYKKQAGSVPTQRLTRPVPKDRYFKRFRHLIRLSHRGGPVSSVSRYAISAFVLFFQDIFVIRSSRIDLAPAA